MLVREAKWFAQRIRDLGDDALFPMVNVGSHTEQFRVLEQPWIDRHIYAPLRKWFELVDRVIIPDNTDQLHFRKVHGTRREECT